MTQTINPAECRFAVYIPPPDHGLPDYHLIKEQVHYPDGSIKPNLRLIKDYKESFWVTKKSSQNHKSKKEYEDREKLIEFKCTQSKLVESIAKAIGNGNAKSDLKRLCNSPYVYGSDLLYTARIKRLYKNKYPELSSAYSVAVFDTETDCIEGTERIIMATLSFKKTVLTVVDSRFLKGIPDAHSRVERAMDKYLGEIVAAREIKSELIIVDNEIDIVRLCIQRAHELKPDFLAIWNIDFDINKIIKACDRARVNPAEIFSDPCVPNQYKYFRYKQGPKKKVTASGKESPIKPPDQWHTVFTPASFYVIDAMCVYKKVRVGKPEEQSYSLDSILNKELGIRKLNFKEADGYVKLKWHVFMQTNYKIEYIIYNRFDCISMELLDEKTLDLSLTMPSFSRCSDFCNFSSQPRRAVDELDHYFKSLNKIIGSTGSEMNEPLDNKLLGLKGWITALPAQLITNSGLQIIFENADLFTSIYCFAGDLDISSAYPTNECVMNISKETTKKEVINIDGINSYISKHENINLSGGQTNALEYCQQMFGFPKLHELMQYV